MYIKPALSLADAKAVAAAARAKAEENNWNVVIAIVDESG
ncbi:MAG: heme-binding protein, partial [Betaproteobacteria bacterium]|nr:heme-binding protein [Betaproteobacteria bacterium]